MIQAAIKALVEGEELTREQTTGAMEQMMTGGATPAQVGAFLSALRIRGETPEVVAASLDVMQRHAEPVDAPGVIDICGTGGDGADTFNVSTAAGFVLAAAGVRVAKHGNRAASSRCGSADVLEAMGARTDLGGEAVARAIDDCGFAFLFAQRFHPAMRHVGGARREMGVRTLFNILGPLANPAQPRRQFVGVGAAVLGPLVAEALRLRGVERAMVVHSTDGLDEISPAAATHAWCVEGGQLTERELTAADFGLPASSLDDVKGGTPEENAATMTAVMSGATGHVADFVLMNASAALWVAGTVDDLRQGTDVAREAIASGKARRVLDRYVALTQELADE